MRRRAPLSVLPLLLAGCGGGGGDASLSLTQYPTLGTSSIDLAGTPLSGTLAGTGTAHGVVTIVSATANGNAAKVTALVQGVVKNGARTDRQVVLTLNDPATFAVGATYTIDGARNSVDYTTTTYSTRPSNGTTAGGAGVSASPGGTVQVVSLQNGVAVLRLADVAFPRTESTSAFVLSGTISGKVVAALDMG